MSTISLRLPDSLHDEIRKLAVRENVSINQLATLAIAEKIAALDAEEFLVARASRGSQTKFRRALGKVSQSPPAEDDRLG